MVDDAFKLSLDVLYPKPPKKEKEKGKGKSKTGFVPGRFGKKKAESSDEYESDDESVESVKSNFAVDGYSDDENMWEFLCKM